MIEPATILMTLKTRPALFNFCHWLFAPVNKNTKPKIIKAKIPAMMRMNKNGKIQSIAANSLALSIKATTIIPT